MTFVVCIMGKSGTGKSTLANELVKQRTKLGLETHIVKSYSSRPPRKWDPKDLETHTFVTPEKYESDLKHGMVLFDYVGTDDNGNKYHNWISEYSFVEGVMNIFVVDPITFAKIFKESSFDFLSTYCFQGIYLELNEEIRKQRLESRGSVYVANEDHLDVSHIENTPFLTVRPEAPVEDMVETLMRIFGFLSDKYE